MSHQSEPETLSVSEGQNANQLYSCSICIRQFKSHTIYERHLQWHRGEAKFICEICGHRMSDTTSFKSHMITHSDGQSFVCHICNKRFKREASLSIHVKTIHNKEQAVKCEICDKTFLRKTALAEHMRRHAGIKSHICDICHQGFACSSNLACHKKTHGQGLRCTQCDKVFFTSQKLEIHMRQHTGERPFKCEQCTKTYTSQNALNEHVKTHILSPVPCPVCDRLFESQASLKRHIARHGQHQCDICLRTYSTRYALKEHFIRMHTDEPLPLKCRECGEGFLSQSRLNTHMRKHTKIKLYKCNTCFKSYSTMSVLKMHQKIHSGEKLHACPVCLKTFYDIYSLNNHMTIHKPEKKFKCSLCSQAFRTKKLLKRHLKVHLITKPYVCDICVKGFKNSITLVKHRQRKHGHGKGYGNQEISDESVTCEVFPNSDSAVNALNDALSENVNIPEEAEGDQDTFQYIIANVNEGNTELSTETAMQNLQAGQYAVENNSEVVIYQGENQMEDCHIIQEEVIEVHGLHDTDSDVIYSTDIIEEQPYEVIVKSESNVAEEKRLSVHDHTYVTEPEQDELENVYETVVATEQCFITDSEIVAPHQVEIPYESEENVVYLTLDPNDIVDGNGDLANFESLVVKQEAEMCDDNMKNESLYNNPSEEADSELLMDPRVRRALTAGASTKFLPNLSKGLEFECATCGQEFYFRNALTKHRRLKHGDEGLYVCLICRRSFNYRGTFRRHMMVHNNIKSRMCNICGKKVTAESDLRAHMISHSEEKPHACPECDKSFKHIKNLRIHMKRHSEDSKPYSCELCPKVFMRKDGLVDHMRRHYGIKPYECNLCDKSFSCKNSLNAHKKVHSNKNLQRLTCPQLE